MRYKIVYAPDATAAVRKFRAHYRQMIFEGVNEHLAHEPERISRSRIKRMEQPAVSTFRLRLGDFRVYYDVDKQAGHVLVLKVFCKGTQTTPERLTP